MSNHLILKNVKKNFGSSEIIRNANLNVKKGEIHSLIGPNGAGKSTLYNLISGVYNLTSGTIEYNKKTISGEIVGDILVKYSKLKGITVPEEMNIRAADLGT